LIFPSNYESFAARATISQPQYRAMAISHLIRHTFITLIFSYLAFSPAIAQSRKEERAFQEAERYYETGIRQSDPLQKQRYTTYAI
jgi:hypothetical protein